MTDRPNIFADCENVGQLFDSLWYHATATAEDLAKHKMMGTGDDRSPEQVFTRAREVAIVQAHDRYQELTNG